jgi:dienelactone hydrolase
MNIRKLLIAPVFLFAILASQAGFTAIISGEVVYRVGDTEMIGYIAYDDRNMDPRPGVLVVHEWWGHNEYARMRARMLAIMGYTALAVDMYGDGKTAQHPKDAGKFAGAVGGNMPLAKARFEAALEALKSHVLVEKDDIAAIGYCFGGGIVLNMARSGVDLDGVVSFHGSLKTGNPAQPGAVKAKVRVFNGAADLMVKPEHVTEFEREMEAAGVDYQLVNYPGVLHSFTNREADSFAKKFDLPLAYDQFADEDSWEKMGQFFREIF